MTGPTLPSSRVEGSVVIISRREGWSVTVWGRVGGGGGLLHDNEVHEALVFYSDLQNIQKI